MAAAWQLLRLVQTRALVKDIEVVQQCMHMTGLSAFNHSFTCKAARCVTDKCQSVSVQQDAVQLYAPSTPKQSGVVLGSSNLQLPLSL